MFTQWKTCSKVKRKLLQQSLFTLLFFLTLFTSCKSVNTTSDLDIELSQNDTSLNFLPEYCTEHIQFLDDGLTYTKYTNDSFPITYHVVKVELDKYKIVSKPKIKEVVEGRIVFEGESTLDYSKRVDAIVAINATPFELPNDSHVKALFDNTRMASGLIAENNFVLSTSISKYGAIVFSKIKGPYIIESQESFVDSKDLSNTTLAVGGFWQILKDSKLYGSFIEKSDSRTAIGISNNGKTIYILVVEGEFGAWSEGLSYKQCAMIFQRLGCKDAIQLDGGSSSTLVINKQNVLGYDATQKNVNNLAIIKK